MRWLVLTCYQGELTLGTETEEEHVEAVAKLLQRLQEKNVNLVLRTCSCGVKEVETLGYRISERQVIPSDSHCGTLSNYRKPANGTELLEFLELRNVSPGSSRASADTIGPLHAILEESRRSVKKKRHARVNVRDGETK